MVVKKTPQTLQALCLQSLSQTLLQEWKNTLLTSNLCSSEHFTNNMWDLLPPALHGQVFDLMVDSHARSIQIKKEFTPGISALVESIISPHLCKLNLHSLRHIGTVPDEEIDSFCVLLLCNLPSLGNLVEINLSTSGRDSTLPICTDAVLQVIGSCCSMLNNLDISYNHYVTDNGIFFLTPSLTQKGCPKLTKLMLFECSVTHVGIVGLLKGIHKLKYLGFRETIQALKILQDSSLSKPTVKPLELAHINNMGSSSRTCKNVNRLECDEKAVNIISSLCPKLTGLKVRVQDSMILHLKKLTSVTILSLVYNLGRPSSPRNNTVQYLQLCGAQLVNLTFLCDKFSTQHLKVVCEECNNLKCLYICCNTFERDVVIMISDRKKCVLTNLEEFKFKADYDYDKLPALNNISFDIFGYVLHKTYMLTVVDLTMRNSILCDLYIIDLFSSIESSTVKKIGIQFSYDGGLLLSPISLTMVTVEALIGICPELEQLGTLSMWDISSEEIEVLKKQLQITNSALVIT